MVRPIRYGFIAALALGLFYSDSSHGADTIPDGMSGFSGTLQGTVSSVGKNQFVLKVSKVVNTWKKNRAESPSSGVGKEFSITGKNEYHKRFIASLKAGESLKIEAVHREGASLQILELNKEQRKRAGVGE